MCRHNLVTSFVFYKLQACPTKVLVSFSQSPNILNYLSRQRVLFLMNQQVTVRMVSNYERQEQVTVRMVSNNERQEQKKRLLTYFILKSYFVR